MIIIISLSVHLSFRSIPLEDFTLGHKIFNLKSEHFPRKFSLFDISSFIFPFWVASYFTSMRFPPKISVSAAHIVSFLFRKQIRRGVPGINIRSGKTARNKTPRKQNVTQTSGLQYSDKIPIW